MSQETVFAKILNGTIPVEFIAETETLVAFYDQSPQAKVHILVIPKTCAYQNVTELAAADPQLLAEMVGLAKELANTHADGDYRLIFNNGVNAGQTVMHVHAHVLAGDLAERGMVGN